MRQDILRHEEFFRKKTFKYVILVIKDEFCSNTIIDCGGHYQGTDIVGRLLCRLTRVTMDTKLNRK